MGGPPTAPDQQEGTSSTPTVVPWLQAIGIFSFVGLGLVDLYVPDAEVPWVVYGGIIAIIWGLGPDVVKSAFKRVTE